MLNINQGLLYSLGVSHEALERLIHVSLRGGAYGAKLVVGRGGGCVAALCPDAKTRNVAAKIESSRGKAILTNRIDQGVTTVLSTI